jgi:2-octaprenylphenol hydroxylase
MIAAAKPRDIDFDVIVIGGGVAGLTLAALLGRNGISVAVVESSTFDEKTIGADYDLRIFAVTEASARILERCGAWQGVLKRRHGSFRRMEVWDENSPGSIRFDSARLAAPTLGYIVEQRVLLAALWEGLSTIPSVTIYRPTTLNSWSLESEHLAVALADGRRLTSRLLVGADGAESRVRDLAGIGHVRRDYDQHALVCNVRTELAHEDTARQRFLATGPLAFLPLDDPYMSSIVWSTSPARCAQLATLEAEEFCATLGAAFDSRLGRVVATGARASFPLARAGAERYIATRVALVGDAAHTIHPLAGQGANLGFLDSASLSEVVINARNTDRDIAAMRVLRQYERWRSGENRRMMAAMDAFKVLFGSRVPAIKWLRGLGLQLTDRSEMLKEWIMRQAMGLSGDLPAAARANTFSHHDRKLVRVD